MRTRARRRPIPPSRSTAGSPPSRSSPRNRPSPTEPIESTEPSLAIERTEPREASDHRESMRHTLAMTMSLDRDSLRADCERCIALCCVAPSFTASADFAIDKPAGVPARTCGPTTAARSTACSAHRAFPAARRTTASARGSAWSPRSRNECGRRRCSRRSRRCGGATSCSGTWPRPPAWPGRRGCAGRWRRRRARWRMGPIAAEDVDRPARPGRRAGPWRAAHREPCGRRPDRPRPAPRRSRAAADLRGAYLIRADLRRRRSGSGRPPRRRPAGCRPVRRAARRRAVSDAIAARGSGRRRDDDGAIVAGAPGALVAPPWAMT